MKVIKTTKNIVCDVNGCNQKAYYFVKHSADDSDYDSLKICKDCAKELVKTLQSALKKEKDNEKD